MDRKERIDSLRKLYSEQRRNFSRNLGRSTQEFEIHWKKNFLVKSTLSIGLIAIVYLLFQFQVPYAKKGQEFIRETLDRDYNFQGVYQWYQEKFDGNPAIIPTFSMKEKQVEKISAIAPVSREIQIEQASQGVMIESVEPEPIMAVANGIVKAVGKNDSLGKTIIVKHASGIETIYGMLNSIDVAKDDWVEAGQVLGMGNKKTYFAIKNETQYLNPMDVIPFD